MLLFFAIFTFRAECLDVPNKLNTSGRDTVVSEACYIISRRWRFDLITTAASASLLDEHRLIIVLLQNKFQVAVV